MKCSVCLKEINDGEEFIDIDEVIYCPDCYEKEIVDKNQETTKETFSDFQAKCKEGPIMFYCNNCKKETMSDVKAYSIKWISGFLYFVALSLSSIIMQATGKYIIGLVVFMILSIIIKSAPLGYRIKSKCKKCGSENSLTVPTFP